MKINPAYNYLSMRNCLFISMLLIIVSSCGKNDTKDQLIDKMTLQKIIQLESQLGSREKKNWLTDEMALATKYFKLAETNKIYCDSIQQKFNFLLDDFYRTQLTALKNNANSTTNDIKLLQYGLLNLIEDYSNRQGVESFIDLCQFNFKVGDTLKAHIGLKLLSSDEYFSIVGNDTLEGILPIYKEVLNKAGHFKREANVVRYKDGEIRNYPVTFEFNVSK